MTQHISPFGKAMTAIAAVLAFSSTPSMAQEAGTPPEPVADTTVETPAATDPLAPELTADQAPAAPQPKVETTRTASTRTKASASSPARSTRRASAPAPATAAAAAAPVASEAATPAPLPTEPQPPMVEPAAPPAAEPVAAGEPSAMDELMTDDMLPIAAAGALGLLALGGAGLAMRRRRRRREDEEFAERQRLLDRAEANQAEPEPVAAVTPGPSFARTPAPMHDPVPARAAPPVAASGGFAMAGNEATELPAEPKERIPERGNWESRNDADFLFRRADKPADEPVEPAK